jgi:sugar phosphate isomerase/epimerase
MSKMKLGITTSLFNACDNKIVEIIPTISSLGVDYIEVVLRDPRSIDIEKFSEILKRYDVSVYAVCAWCNYAYQNPAHYSRYVREAYVNYLNDLVDFAARVGAKIIVTSAGIIEGISREEAYEHCAKCLREIGNYSSSHGIRVGVEVVNRFITNFINRTDQALKLIKSVDDPFIGITLDTFHMNIEEKSIAESIRKAEKSLFHVHLADSNRLAPGLGHIDFNKIIDVLKEIDYKGNLSLEIQARDDPIREAKFGLDFMKNILSSNNDLSELI